MYDIKQFRPVLFLALLMGITGFSMAIASPGLWIFATGAVMLNAWLIRIGSFRPMPRIVANIITLICAAWCVFYIRTGITPIIAIGQFLVLLQLVKVFEQRVNRDYAQLLVLSLLLMVAAAITTATLWFGLLLIAYLIVSLYCCLLFHLKVESDLAKAQMGLKDPRIMPPSLRQDQRYLPKSMRRVTSMVALVSMVTAVATFLLVPRGTGANFLTPLTIQPQVATTGFSDTVSFQQVARITQSNEEVAKVWVWNDEQLTEGTDVILLRGVTLEVYGGSNAETGKWQWSSLPDRSADSVQAGANEDRLLMTGIPRDQPRIKQQVNLRPGGHNVLFGIGGIYQFKPSRDLRIRYSPRTQSLRLVDNLERPLEYTVVSSGVIQSAPGSIEEDYAENPQKVSHIDPRIDQLVRDVDVSGGNADGAYFEQRDKSERVTELDGEIARSIERYLQSNFQYTLDLTDAKRIGDKDPLVAFLEDFKRGHCEYFAGAMTVMCQSLGLQARMVVGFKCDEYNNMGGFYTVRQSHAHAWVEVLQSDGTWHTYDPTSSDDAGVMQPGFTQKVRQFLDFLNYKWADAVVAYDADARTGMWMQVEQKLTNTAIQTTGFMAWLKQWLKLGGAMTISSNVLAIVIGLMLLALAGSVGWFILERVRMRRRAARIGIDALPTAEQIRLVRQLKFYDELVRLLERNQIVRPEYMTHMEFSESLNYLPTDAYDIIRRMTRIFYRVRYGNRKIAGVQHRRLENMLEKVNESLARRQTGAV